MRLKPRRGLTVVAALCLVAILAAAMVPADGDPIGVLASVMCLADAPAPARAPFRSATTVLPDDAFGPPAAIRGPPIA